ncbi:GGDEF domain-containing protein [Martelella limonii]|uniref:GGDEF domain-containing protein n=1 Tax=Martelella limonii TaxID=1647649 RepID=UPI00157FE64E|nr:GGDEF domain-containing protein [Martelella limonii]
MTFLPQESASLLPVFAQEIIVSGFWLLYLGTRRFFGRAIRVKPVSTALLITLALLIFFRERWLLRDSIFVFAQILPLFLILPLFVKHGNRHSFGIPLAAAGVVIGMLSHLATGISSAMMGLQDYVSPATENVQSYGLLLIIVSGSLLIFGIAVMIIENLLYEAENIARRDELTGISNRRDFMKQIARVHAFCESENVPYGVLIFDIDRFKSWNDTYGHATGDEALLHFTRTILGQLDDSQLLARTGGDEFCLLLPGKAEKHLSEIAEAMVVTVRNQPLSIDGQPLTMTISVGGAVYMPGSQEDYNDILAKADSALYRSKNNGRNQFSLYDEREGRTGDVAPLPRFGLISQPEAVGAHLMERRA